MHGHHEATALWRRHLGLVDGNASDERSNTKPVDQATSHEHAVVDRSRADGSADDEHDGGELDGTLPAKLVGTPGADRGTDGRSGTVDAVEGSDVFGGPTISGLILSGKI